jgi:hypothetical protein
MFKEVVTLKKIYRGTVEGNVIRVEEIIDLPLGTQTLVTLKTMNKENQEDIRNRQLRLLDQGFAFGKKLYRKREDLYGR